MNAFFSIITLASALLGSLHADTLKEKKGITNDKTIAEANKLLCNGELDKALSLLNECIANHPENIRALRLRGNVYFAKDDYTSSLQDFNTILSLTPSSGKAYFDRGIIHLAMDADELAFDDIEKAFVLNPELARNLESRPDIGEKIRELREKAHTAKHQVIFKQGLVSTKKGGVITKAP